MKPMTPKSIQFMQNCGFLNTNNFLNSQKHKISRGICARQLSVLVLNCGSSSIKFKILDSESGEITLDGQANNLNTNKGKLKWSSSKKEKFTQSLEKPVFVETLDKILKIAEQKEFSLIGHRVVHGGEIFKSATKLNQETITNMKKLNNLAPLHNPIQIKTIERCLQAFPQIPQGASFDTAFYANIPEYAYLYPVPYSWYTNHKVRRYGFHGLSHEYVVRKACELLDRAVVDTNMISCHLGAGCSVTATKGGVGVDTSMGFTPLSGVMMGSRSGDIDPTILTYLATEMETTPEEIIKQLNNNSGLKGITGSPDSLVAENLYLQNDEMGKLAVEMFCYSIAKYIASYLATLGRLDCLVFTGGIGEKSSVKRDLIMQKLSGLGIFCDSEKNIRHGAETNGCVSAKASKVPVYVISTNEELVIAQQTYELYK